MKCRPVGYYLVINITPIVPVGKPLMSVGYTYNSHKIILFVATEGSSSNDPGNTYLSILRDTYYNLSVCLFFCIIVFDLNSYHLI